MDLRWRIIIVAALLGTAPGCELYRIDTVLHPDGSVTRAIYQPQSTVPAAARRPEAWQHITYALEPDRLEKQGWSGKITDLPIQASTQDRAYFAGWGTFPSVARLPDHFVHTVGEGKDAWTGKLVRTYLRNDYAFVVEHIWTETLTDVVTLRDMDKARDELVELLLRVGEDVFGETLGKDYDATELFQWLRTEGKSWLAESLDFAFVHCARHKGPAARAALEKGLLDIAGRHGLRLWAEGKPLKGDALQRAVEEFAVDRVARSVRRKKDGQRVDRETVVGWQIALDKPDEKDAPNPFKAAAKKVLAEKYGGEEAFQKRTEPLLMRIFGLYQDLILGKPRKFECTLTVPGEVVETNAQILDANRVRWDFEAKEAWPLGYEMACTSLETQPEMQKALLGGPALSSREERLRFRALVTGSDQLAGALRDCRQQKSLAPLYAQYGKDPSVAKLLKLLKLPADPPKGM
jgi:hypothetical protein